jgi:predicted transcriptional regulator
MYIKTDNPDLVRDPSCNALLNVNAKVVNRDLQYKSRLMKEKETESTINNLQEEIKVLRSEISQVLQLLKNDRGN